MGVKLPEGKKLIIEMTNEGYRNVFAKNKWGDFLNYVQKVGLGRKTNVPKGIVVLLVDIGVDLHDMKTTLEPKFTPVTPEDIERSRVLVETPDVPDVTGLPPFAPFGEVEPSEDANDPEEELVDSERAKAMLDRVQPKVANDTA